MSGAGHPFGIELTYSTRHVTWHVEEKEEAMRALGLVAVVITGLWFVACDDSPSSPSPDADVDGDVEEPACERDEDCDDGIECTDEYCTSGRCRRSSDDSVCDDGLRCNGLETCRGADGCVPGDLVVCDDGVECTTDQCDLDVDRCVSEPDDSACSGGYVCDPAQDGCVPEE